MAKRKHGVSGNPAKRAADEKTATELTPEDIDGFVLIQMAQVLTTVIARDPSMAIGWLSTMLDMALEEQGQKPDAMDKWAVWLEERISEYTNELAGLRR